MEWPTSDPQRRLLLTAISAVLWLATVVTTRAVHAQCVGDCNRGGRVVINEILTMVNLALGKGLVVDCLAGDANADGRITVDEILAAVNSALEGCPLPPTPLADQGASTGTALLPISTMQSIQILTFGYIAAQPAHAVARQYRLAGPVRMALTARGEAGVAAGSPPPDTECDSGTATVTCTVTSGSSALSVTYSDCHTATPSGHTVVRNGTVTQTVANPTFCDSRSIPSDAAVTLQLSDFTLTESDSASTVLAEISATITDHSAPTGGSCTSTAGEPLINSTEVIDGAQTVVCEPAADSLACPAPDTNLALVVNTLTLQRTASLSGTAGACQLVIIAQGNLEVDNHALGDRVALTFDQTRLSEPPDGNGSTGFAIDGLLHADCLGDATFHTSQPILMQPGTKCPAAGAFEVSVVNTESAASAVVGGPLPAAVHFAHALSLDATQTNSVIDEDGFRQTVFRATDGTVYQILQNVNANANLGADDFQVTTLLGSQVDVEGCAGPAGGAFEASAVVAALFGPAFDPARVTKSFRITNVSPPCLDPETNDGVGSVCIGPDCTSACACPDGGSCTAFTLATGTSATTATDVPAVTLVSLAPPEKACSGFAGGQTYAFGSGNPTIEAGLCAAVPADGFALPNGTSVIFAYHVPLGTSFFLGAAGFPIDRDGRNPFKCPANTVLATGRASPDLLPPPSVQYTASGGVDFDFNRDGIIDQSVSTCEDRALLLCGPVPIATPIPNPICPPTDNDLGDAASVTRSGTTAGQPNGLGGASCGRGGNEAPDVAFVYTAPSTGFYTIDTIGSAFDSLLYVRDGSCGAAELACNDDITPATDVRSQVGLFLNGGQQIVIVVDGFGTSSGSFALHVNLRSAVAPTPTPTPAPQTGLPDLVVTELMGPTTAMPGDAVTVSVTVANQGTADAGGFQVGFVVSLTPTISADDTSTGFSCSFGGLAAGERTSCTTSIVVPPTLRPATYHLGAVADFTNQVRESNEENNARAADTGPLVLGGPFWESHGPDGGGRVQALAIDPATPATLYVGTEGGGVFKSTDAGAHWVAMNVGLPNTFFDVDALAIDPATPATLYAGTDVGGGVFKSSDAGAHWAAMTAGLPPFTVVLALAIDPVTPSTLYAGTLESGVVKSVDAGAHWAVMNLGLSETLVRAIAVDPVNPTKVYAGTDAGVFRSTDGGAHWEANVGLPDNTSVSALAIDPATPATIYAGTFGGVFKSTDAGVHWAAMNVGLSNIAVLALTIDPATPATLYAGTIGGVFKSTDSGAHWTVRNVGLSEIFVRTLAIDPATPATLYAGIIGGVFKSTDAAAHWARMSVGLSDAVVRALAIDPATPATLYAGTGDAGVFKSTDGGVHWTAMNDGLPAVYIGALGIDPGIPATIYAGTYLGGVFKSTDGGSHWAAMNVGFPSFPSFPTVFALAIDPATTTTLYAGTLESGVFRSTDSGAHWVDMNVGLSDRSGSIVTDIDALAIDPVTPTTVYAGTIRGVFKSTDAGFHWAMMSAGLPDLDIFRLAIDPATPTTLYAGTGPFSSSSSLCSFNSGCVFGVFKSTDAGAHWAAMNVGLSNTFVGALAIDPATPATLYVGTDGGVFKSTDAGATWRVMSSGLSNTSVNALAIDPMNSAKVYAGTAGGGVFALQPAPTQ